MRKPAAMLVISADSGRDLERGKPKLGGCNDELELVTAAGTRKGRALEARLGNELFVALFCLSLNVLAEAGAEIGIRRIGTSVSLEVKVVCRWSE